MKPKTLIRTINGDISSRDEYDDVRTKFGNALDSGITTFDVMKAAGGFDSYPEDAVTITVVTDKVISIERVPR